MLDIRESYALRQTVYIVQYYVYFVIKFAGRRKKTTYNGCFQFSILCIIVRHTVDMVDRTRLSVDEFPHKHALYFLKKHMYLLIRKSDVIR